jgi:hypothetical protein
MVRRSSAARRLDTGEDPGDNYGMGPLPEAWRAEFDELRRERDLAFRELAQLRVKYDEFARMVAGLKDRADHLTSVVRRRESQLKKAERENRKLRRKLGLDEPDPDPPAEEPPPEPPPSEPPPSEPGSPSSGEPAATAPRNTTTTCTEEDPPAPPAKPRTPAREEPDPKKRPRSRGGRRVPPTHVPADKERHAVCACRHCGGRVFKRDVLSTTVYTAVSSHVRRRVIERERVICANADCNEPTTAPMPPMPCERALYDCSFLAWLVVMKFVLLVPLDRLRLLLRSQGVDLAMGTLVHLIERAADLGGAVDGEHMKQLRAGAWMCFDGTGLKALVTGQHKAWDGYLEVYTRDELTVFQFDLTKHADRMKDRMNGFLGILVTDAETRNSAGAPGVTLANCNAHPRRALREAEHVQPRLAAQGVRFFKALYALEDQADAAGLVGDARVAFRRRHSLRVLRRFRQWLEGVVARPLPPSDPVRKVAKYYLKHFKDLTRFVDHGELPLDNNQAEREFQRHAKLRYASLFAGSPEGGHRWATLLGVTRTAQKCGVDVQAYLTWMFERRGTHRARFGLAAAELTPMAYRDQLARASASA